MPKMYFWHWLNTAPKLTLTSKEDSKGQQNISIKPDIFALTIFFSFDLILDLVLNQICVNFISAPNIWQSVHRPKGHIFVWLFPHVVGFQEKVQWIFPHLWFPFLFLKWRSAHAHKFYYLRQDQSTVAQQAETTVEEHIPMSCKRTCFPE